MLRSLVFFILISFSLQSQTDSVYTGRDTTGRKESKRKIKNEEWKKDLTYGGNFQAWFGNPTFIFLSPTIGYNFFDNFNAGVGIIYNYTQFNTGIYGKISQSIFGGHSYMRYIIAQNYFVQAQYDRLLQPDYFSYVPDQKRWVDYLLVGGGLRQSVGNKAAIITSLMYNVTPNPLSIYPSRLIVQFGFVAGF
jgi:hypothetical protein